MNNNAEIWKPIPTYENMYAISNLGNVKSLERECNTTGGGKRKVRERIKSPVFIVGYHSVNLYDRTGGRVYKQEKIHRLVAAAFIPNPENKPLVNHKNGIKTDNRVENLEWCTASENCIHAIQTGLVPPRFGEKAPNVKLTHKQVLDIREKLKNKEKGVDIAKLHNISQGMVSLIKHNKNWNK